MIQGRNQNTQTRTKMISNIKCACNIYHRDQSTKDKDSNSNSDGLNREAKLEEIKRSMQERKIKRFDDALNKQQIEMEKLRGLAWNGVPSSKHILSII
jgi:hypothetical protein